MNPAALAALAAAGSILLIAVGISGASVRAGERIAAIRERERRALRGARSSGERRAPASPIDRALGLQWIGVRRDLALLLIAGGGIAAGGGLWLITQWTLPAVFTGAAVAVFVPRQIASARQGRDRRALEEAIADAATAIRDIVQTGGTIQQAFRALSEYGPDRLQEECSEVERQSALYDMQEALARSQLRVAHPAWDNVAVALAFAVQSGGDRVSELMNDLANDTRSTIRAHNESLARAAQGIMTGRIMGVLPFVLLFATCIRSPENVETFRSLTGQIVLTGAFAAIIGGWLWVTKMAAASEQPRILRPWPPPSTDE